MDRSRSGQPGVAKVEEDGRAGITLLERLSAPEGDAACRPIPSAAAVRASVADELTRLFRTRRPQGDGLSAGLAPTVLDYGLPDITSFSIGQHQARQKLAKEVTQAVGWFESRLLAPEVGLSEARRAGGLARVRVVAGIAIAGEVQRFDFETDL